MLNAEVLRLRRLLPITRVFDVTPLDLLGIPVWAAVTPLAADLTVHMGVGWTAEAATRSAVFEAVERVTAERVPQGRTMRGSFAQLRARRGPGAVLDPATLDLPFETGYRPDAEIHWVPGRDLISGGEVLVPRDAVVSPASEGICVGPETAGLAAGPTVQAATAHALLELVERDALGLDQIAFAHRAAGWAPRMVDPRAVSDDLDGLLDLLEASGAQVRMQEVTSDLGVATYSALLVLSQPGAGGLSVFEGSSADPSPQRAMERAVLEAVQAHTGTFLGARDTYEVQLLPARPARLRERLDQLLRSAPARPFADSSPAATGEDWFTTALTSLERAGLPTCIAIELTDAEIAVPVVRVLVPGLGHLYGQSRRRPGPRLLRAAFEAAA